MLGASKYLRISLGKCIHIDSVHKVGSVNLDDTIADHFVQQHLFTVNSERGRCIRERSLIWTGRRLSKICSNEPLLRLAGSDTWFMGGTFKGYPEIFKQLYEEHRHYKVVFVAVQQRRKITMEFEQGAKNNIPPCHRFKSHT